MKDMEKEKIELFELDTWQNLIRTDEWLVFLELLKDHVEFLNNNALLCVRKGDFHNAVRYEAKAEDAEKLLSLVKDRITALKTGGIKK